MIFNAPEYPCIFDYPDFADFHPNVTVDQLKLQQINRVNSVGVWIIANPSENALDRRRRYLLLELADKQDEQGQNLFGVPAGKFEPNRDFYPEDTAVREVREETGIAIGYEDLQRIAAIEDPESQKVALIFCAEITITDSDPTQYYDQAIRLEIHPKDQHEIRLGILHSLRTLDSMDPSQFFKPEYHIAGCMGLAAAGYFRRATETEAI